MIPVSGKTVWVLGWRAPIIRPLKLAGKPLPTFGYSSIFTYRISVRLTDFAIRSTYLFNPIYFLSMNIYVANINFRASEDDLKDLFSQYGEVTSVKILKDRETNRSRGFGFVEMSDDSAGQAAISALNGAEFSQRNLVVKEALPPKK